jgi:hypothetical protein
MAAGKESALHLAPFTRLVITCDASIDVQNKSCVRADKEMVVCEDGTRFFNSAASPDLAALGWKGGRNAAGVKDSGVGSVSPAAP